MAAGLRIAQQLDQPAARAAWVDHLVDAEAFRGADGVQALACLLDQLGADPNWNGGWHYGRDISKTMIAQRMDTLRRYGTNEILARTIPDAVAREARMREMAARWAEEFDANSLVTLRKAMVRFDAGPELKKIRARVLYVLSRTDVLRYLSEHSK